MAYIQQTKVGATGGPQYYLQELPPEVKKWLRQRGACVVVLRTPYGIASTGFFAVGANHKMTDRDKVIPGKVGHDRIQSAGGESIGEVIRNWFGLPPGRFERITVNTDIHKDGHFIITPMEALLRDRKRPIIVESLMAPLAFNSDHESRLWRDQINGLREGNIADYEWVKAQITRVVLDNQDKSAANLHEVDLLRSSGALSKIGLQLGPYRTKGYDCAMSAFQFGSYPKYECPVEVKRRSSGFEYQMRKYPILPRVVVLCIEHDQKNLPEHVDVLELQSLCRHMN